MYVRWKIKKVEFGIWGTPASDYALMEGYLNVAYLVESKRINGKPRQKTRYLGSIRGRYLTSAEPARDFWQRVHAKLDTFRLPDDVRSSIEQQLAQRVPRPSE